jgi:hypothetical protein
MTTEQYLHEIRARKDHRGVMSCLKLALLTCSVALFVNCHRQTTVTGSVFIVTKGKENIKLGLVQVSAIPQRAVLKYLPRAAAKLASRENELRKMLADNPPWGTTIEKNRRAREELQRLSASQPDAAKRLIFDDLPAGIAVATTDADGKFTMQLPADTPVVLVAHSSRGVGTTTEEYYWLCRFSASSRGNPILLSNQNLLSDNTVAEVLAGLIPTL